MRLQQVRGITSGSASVPARQSGSPGLRRAKLGWPSSDPTGLAQVEAAAAALRKARCQHAIQANDRPVVGRLALFWTFARALAAIATGPLLVASRADTKFEAGSCLSVCSFVRVASSCFGRRRRRRRHRRCQLKGIKSTHLECSALSQQFRLNRASSVHIINSIIF